MNTYTRRSPKKKKRQIKFKVCRSSFDVFPFRRGDDLLPEEKEEREREREMGFENVVGGKLKLKGAAAIEKPKKKKKKKKKKTEEKEGVVVDEDEDPLLVDGERKNATTASVSSREQQHQQERKRTTDTRTNAEKAHDERSRLQRKKMILEQAELTHKEKVRMFNEKLARLSEHHDIPKVGPG